MFSSPLSVEFSEGNKNKLTNRLLKTNHSLQSLIFTDFCGMTPSEINKKWTELREKIAKDFDSELPDMKVMLFLIGVQELGKGPLKFSKRQKEELMHIANCRLFSELGFYELEGVDQDGWPHWNLVKKIPAYTLLEQEMIMRSLMINYFENI